VWTAVPIPRPTHPPHHAVNPRQLPQPHRRAGAQRPEWEPRWELPCHDPLPETYLLQAAYYTQRATLFPGWREQLIRGMGLQPGATVVDVGCGPALNIPALRERIGPHGTIIGIDDSPELLAVAAHRVAHWGWDNVELIHTSEWAMNLSALADAALFAAVPTVMANPTALTNIVTQLRPGAAVAAGGWKWPSARFWPGRALLSTVNRLYPSDTARLVEPWRLLAEHLPALRVRELGLGTGYLAHTPPPTNPSAIATHDPGAS